ncbi:hypothetical protein Pcinc_013278 [Petrolisthes cinctipes]|uniref:Uncharacterized protein n=1 Tax=Petrolisthes cinctipes TaxID=88211 RepID=A0AAE1FX57_PETCI|nr:hypothetical protein Pcinc_013278 [Petrolisthes cinctipes]
MNGIDREVLELVLDSEGYLAGGEMRDQETQPYSSHAFNVKVSNNMPLIRTLPDTRHPQCGMAMWGQVLGGGDVDRCGSNCIYVVVGTGVGW